MASEPPVLAYLFTLRRARHPMPHIWTNYFNSCPAGSYRIHIHVDPTFNGTDIEEKGPAARYFNRKHTLPRTQLIKVRRFGHELVRARMKLLRHAIEATAAKGQPVPLYHTFFSESCAPIAPCAATHEYLRRAAAASPPRSFIEDNQTRWTRNDPHIDSDDQKLNTALWRSEFAKVCPGCQGIGLPASDFRFSPGWVTLWHEHAKVWPTRSLNAARRLPLCCLSSSLMASLPLCVGAVARRGQIRCRIHGLGVVEAREWHP